jgi:hypothetical protein
MGIPDFLSIYILGRIERALASVKVGEKHRLRERIIPSPSNLLSGEYMARSRNATRKKYQKLFWLIPVIALIVTAAVLALAILPPPPPATPVMNYQDQIVIQMTNKNGSLLLANIIPDYARYAIGEAGGYWATHTYDSYGVDPQHYPVYMDSPSVSCPIVNEACLFHVKSKTQHQFTLGDFFDIWGQTVGQNNTLGITRVTEQVELKNGTYVNGTFAWQLCTGPVGSATPFTGPYGSLVLQDQMEITLIFYDTTNGVGCA